MNQSLCFIENILFTFNTINQVCIVQKCDAIKFNGKHTCTLMILENITFKICYVMSQSLSTNELSDKFFQKNIMKKQKQLTIYIEATFVPHCIPFLPT